MRVALAGDTMLGRGVADRLAEASPEMLFAPGVVDVVRDADLFVLNLECCISERGDPWPDPRKPFFFRAPPAAVGALEHLGVDCVTLANNHALDFGPVALEDTLRMLTDAGIDTVGAGMDAAEARRPAILDTVGERLAVLGLTDHPRDFAAGPDTAGVAFADVRAGELPAWIGAALANADSDLVLVTPHWGPNMTTEPPPHVRAAADGLVALGATLVAGHSAHLFHGVAPPVLFDLGDFIDDYAVDPALRNDLGLLWFVEAAADGVRRIEAVPIALDYCFTRLAEPEESRWVERRLRDACAAFGREVSREGHRLVVG